MNNPLYIMCLAGSVVYLCYLILRCIFKHRFHPSLRLFMLGFSALFYLLPFPVLFRNILLQIQTKYTAFIQQAVLIPGSKIIYVTETGKKIYPRYSAAIYLLMTIWILVLLFFFIRQLYKYLRFRKNCFRISSAVDESCFLHKEINMRFFPWQRIEFRSIHGNFSPFTLGYIHPVIFLPEHYVPDCPEEIIKHEMFHIRHYDNFWKFFGYLVVAVHWYCPLAFLYFKSLENVLEIYCDYHIVKNFSSKKQADYMELLLQAFEPISNPPNSFMPFSSFYNYKLSVAKERILMIKHCKSKVSLISAFSAIFAVFLSSTTIMAYQPMTEEKLSPEYQSDELPSADSYETFFRTEEMKSPENFQQSREIVEQNQQRDYSLSNTVFISESGTIYPVYSNSASVYSCSHVWEEGIIEKHKKNSDGSCTVTSYHAKRCTKCGQTITGSLINTLSWAICPH